jgi:hypothetical protein
MVVWYINSLADAAPLKIVDGIGRPLCMLALAY